ncbi:hypothetical protein HDU76_001905, partial [Blyttiomyces sp. JEL0837]
MDAMYFAITPIPMMMGFSANTYHGAGGASAASMSNSSMMIGCSPSMAVCCLVCAYTRFNTTKTPASTSTSTVANKPICPVCKRPTSSTDLIQKVDSERLFGNGLSWFKNRNDGDGDGEHVDGVKRSKKMDKGKEKKIQTNEEMKGANWISMPGVMKRKKAVESAEKEQD